MRHVLLLAGIEMLMTEPRRFGLDTFGEADEAYPGTQPPWPSDPENAFLKGRLIDDSRPLTVGSQQLLDDADIPRLVASRFRGEPTPEMPGWVVRLV